MVFVTAALHFLDAKTQSDAAGLPVLPNPLSVDVLKAILRVMQPVVSTECTIQQVAWGQGM